MGGHNLVPYDSNSPEKMLSGITDCSNSTSYVDVNDNREFI